MIDENQDISLSDDNKTKWICTNCTNIDIPFSNLDDKNFFLCSKGVECHSELENISFELDTKSKQLVQQLSNLIVETTDPDNPNLNFVPTMI